MEEDMNSSLSYQFIIPVEYRSNNTKIKSIVTLSWNDKNYLYNSFETVYRVNQIL